MKSTPITKDWQPNKNKESILSKILFEKCKQTESDIKVQLENEKLYNINNFDSGVVLEDIMRKSIENLIPHRYKVSKGIVCDRDGKTSGEHDIVIFNDFWFPYLTGKNSKDERVFFPIEGVYALGEVKQTLNLDTLDEGLKKLVIAQRLNRPRVGENRYSENRKDGDLEFGISNPLFTFLITADFDDSKFSFDDLFNRFVEINKSLHRQEMIRALCVCGQFFISWVYLNEETNEYDVARFTDTDKKLPLIPALKWGEENNESSFFNLVMILGAHLNASILGSEDIYVAYGNDNNAIRLPPIQEYSVYNY